MDSNTCRLCNSSDGIMIPIFEEGDINNSIYRKVLRLFDIQIYADNIHSNYFCFKCVHQVEQALILKKKLETFQRLTDSWCVSCCFCNIETKSCADLESHLKTSHPTKEDFFCQHCGIHFPSFALYCAHCLRAHKERTFKCPLCNRNFDQQSNLEEHLKSHELKTFSCKYCKAVFQDVSSCKEHMSLHSERICRFCLRKFSNKEDCSHHMKGCLRLFLCRICKEEFKEKKAMMEHVVAFHEEFKTRCIKCEKTFSRANELFNHKCIGCGCPPGVSRCDSCRKLSAATVPPPMQQRLRQCFYCPKKFKSKSSRETHLRTHTGEMPYKCSECERSFRQLANLKMHIFRKHKRNQSSHQDNLSPPVPYAMDTSTYLLNPPAYSGTIDPSQVFYTLDMDYPSAVQGPGPSYQ